MSHIFMYIYIVLALAIYKIRSQGHAKAFRYIAIYMHWRDGNCRVAQKNLVTLQSIERKLLELGFQLLYAFLNLTKFQLIKYSV